MNSYKEDWMKAVGVFATGAITGKEPEIVAKEKYHSHKQEVGKTAVRFAATIALADGPLPFGDAIAAGVLGITGIYLLLS